MNKYIKIKLGDYVNEKKQHTQLLAPNGKLSNLSKELYEYVRTEEFKNWFGDWQNKPNTASKVIDENGEPLVCYHGTNTKFDNFDIKYQKDGWLGRGFYFTNDKKLSKTFGKFTLICFLNICNPFIVNGESPSDVITDIKTAYNLNNIINFDNDISIILKKHNHDGIFFKHWEMGNILSCFYSNQINLIRT